MTTTTSLLCQQCTVGTVESFHQNIRRSEKRPLNWSPSSALLKLKCQHHHYLCGTLWKLQSSSRRNIIKCASATEKEPTVETASKVLEQGTQQQAQQPMQQQQQARARFVPRTFTVANEELVVGKVLTGKVKAIMTFGAFIDLGARIDGLLHISKMGAGFVKNVEDVVQMGQELQVQIIDADIENKRVKLKVYNAPDPTRSNATGAAPRKVAGQGAPKPVGVSSVKKTSQYKRGQAITGVVKNLTQRGCFVQLPGGEEGFLSSTELPTLDSKLQVGKEVNVKVLRVIDGRLTLTAKEETDLKKINEELNKDVFATNAFEVAFRKSAVIMKLLDESKKLAAAKEEAVVAVTGLGEQLNVVEGATPESEVKKIQDAEPENSSKVEVTAEEEKLKDSAPELANEQAELKKTVEDSVAQAVEETEAEVSIAELASEAKENAVEAEPKVKPAEDVAPVGTSQDIKAPDANTSAEDVTEKYPETEANAAAGKAVDPVSEAEASLEIVVPEINATAEDVVKKDLGSDASQDMKAPEANAEAEDTADEPEPSQDIKVPEATADRDPVTELEPSQDLKVPATTADRDPVTEPEPSQDIKIPEADAEAENAAEVPLTEAEASQKVAAAETEVKTVSEAHVSIKNDVNGITSAAVKKLREQSGAGMMDCKKALVETNGDMEKAAEHLRKKGLAGADKKANRIAAEGAIGSYVHDGRIGVLFEVNSETDFVARGEIFTQLVEDLGMQIAASEQVEFVSVDDIPAELKQKEFDIEMQREDLQSKPEAIRAKIVEGRVAKRLSELALLEQPFIKNDGIFVKDLVKQTIATVGEKIQVRRFTKYVLGEGLEKRKHDLAAEVAEQSQAKEKKPEADVKVEADQQVNNKVGDDDVSISAALVKQLRGETGTGMMDCKKALKEVKGNYEEAKEYLRKKGLASAEKKVGRVTAEGAIVSYVHSGRIGVLIEVNTETDFVARNSVFRELAEDLAMQVVANPQVEYVSIEDVPAAVREKEMEIELQREDLLSKPEHIRGKIVEGRVSKLMSERALLEQPFLKDDTVLVKDVLKKATTTLGEHIRLRRFVRYTLGEGIRKKSSNFAEEVAAQVKAC